MICQIALVFSVEDLFPKPFFTFLEYLDSHYNKSIWLLAIREGRLYDVPFTSPTRVLG